MRLNPSECLLNENQPSLWIEEQAELNNMSIVATDFPSSYSMACDILQRHFKVATLEGFGIDDSYNLAVSAAAAIISYFERTCHAYLHHLQAISIHYSDQYLNLDTATRRNLELTKTLRDGKERALYYLFWITAVPPWAEGD